MNLSSALAPHKPYDIILSATTTTASLGRDVEVAACLATYMLGSHTLLIATMARRIITLVFQREKGSHDYTQPRGLGIRVVCSGNSILRVVRSKRKRRGMGIRLRRVPELQR